jgi:hypothetical protein
VGEEMHSKLLKVKVGKIEGPWLLSGVSVANEGVNPDSQLFSTLGMIQNVPAICSALLHENALLKPTTQLEILVKSLVDIVEGVSIHRDDKRLQACLCLMRLVADSLLSETQRSNIIMIVQGHARVANMFSYHAFIECTSTELQKQLITFVDVFGLKRQPSTRKATNLLIIQVFQELSFTGQVTQTS